MQNTFNDYSISSCFYYSAPFQYYAFVPITPANSESSFQTFDNAISTSSCLTPSSIGSNSADQDQFSTSYLYQRLEGCQNIILKSSQMMQEHGRIQSKEIQSSIQTKSQKKSSDKKEKQIVEENLFNNLASNLKQKNKKSQNKDEHYHTQDDNQYLPNLKQKKKTPSKYHENENRNIVPNEINQIFSFIGKKAKSGNLVQKLFLKYPHPSSCSLKRYYLYQGLLKNKLGHYSNQKSLKIVTELYQPKCESWSEQEQRYYNKISRVLIHHFLCEDSIFIILTSKRMKNDKKHAHLSARRYVANQVLSIIKGY